jgi:hypothetical protein
MMTTGNQDESRYEPVVIERRCPLAVRIISMGMIFLAIFYGLNSWLLSLAVTLDEIRTLLITFSFFACITHFYAGIFLPRLDFIARWLALVNVAADCGLAGFFVYSETIYRRLPARTPMTVIIHLPDIGYMLTICSIALVVLIIGFIVLTHPKTVEAFEAE